MSTHILNLYQNLFEIEDLQTRFFSMDDEDEEDWDDEDEDLDFGDLDGDDEDDE